MEFPNDIKKILAVKLRSMGDTVLFTSSLQLLRTQFPRAEIHAVVTSTWAPLLEHHPAVDRVWPYHRHEHRPARARALAGLAFKLRQENFDAVVNAHASPSSALLSFASGARRRAIHFHGPHDRNRFSNVLIPGKGLIKPALQRDIDTVTALSGRDAPPPAPTLALIETELEWARQWIGERLVGGPVLVVSAGASRPTKMWGIDRFAEVASLWTQRTHGHVILCTALGETPASELPVTWPDHTHFLHGASVRKLASVLSLAQVWLGNDSGPKHLAVALGIPTVTIMGPEDPFEWHPYSQDRNPYFFVSDLACRNSAEPGNPPWCGIPICTIEQHKCMRSIESAPVAERCVRFVTEVGP